MIETWSLKLEDWSILLFWLLWDFMIQTANGNFKQPPPPPINFPAGVINAGRFLFNFSHWNFSFPRSQTEETRWPTEETRWPTEEILSQQKRNKNLLEIVSDVGSFAYIDVFWKRVTEMNIYKVTEIPFPFVFLTNSKSNFSKGF